MPARSSWRRKSSTCAVVNNAVTLTSGAHQMRITASGDTDLSHYVVVYYGNCTSSGAITATIDIVGSPM